MCSFCWKIKGLFLIRYFCCETICLLLLLADFDHIQVPNGGAVPAEFDSLIGSKMLFIIDKGFNHSKLLDGTFKVKRVCSDPQIIQRFLAEGPFITPVKVNEEIFHFLSSNIFVVFCY
jgi:hypothetical protein